MYRRERWYFVYIVTNRSKTLYVGVTGNLRKRIYEHKTGAFDGFTKRLRACLATLDLRSAQDDKKGDGAG
jgi:predicted GIY-YIG superfamily endonuclease